MRPIPTTEQLPLKCIEDGTEEVWWWNNQQDSWMLGIAMLMDFEDPNTFEKFTHWLPLDALPHPFEDIGE